MAKQHSETVPKATQSAYEAIVELTNTFCRAHLNDEYAALCRSAAAALGRKRPSPLVRGRPEIWACAIIHALGTVNFLFDSSQKPHVTVDALYTSFGVNKSTGGSKAKLVRDTLGMSHFDKTWSLPSILADSPLTWLIEINGFIVDARNIPREMQEIAYLKGLIPYIPADR